MLNMRTITINMNDQMVFQDQSITNEPMFSISVNRIDSEMAAVTLIDRHRLINCISLTTSLCFVLIILHTRSMFN